MANDRLIMKCKICKETRSLVKYYPWTHGLLFDPDSLDDWLFKHVNECGGESGRYDAGFGGYCVLELWAESDPEFRD